MRFTMFIFLSFFPAFCSSQIFGADLSLRVEVQPPMPVPLGTDITVKFTARNNSAFPVFAAIIRLRDPIPPNVPPFDQVGFEFNTSCSICENFSVVCFETGLLNPGAEAQCEYTRPAQTYAGNPQRLRWGVANFPVGTDDPNSSNNFVQFEYRFLPPIPVQVRVAPFSYGLMSFLLLGIGFLSARKS